MSRDGPRPEVSWIDYTYALFVLVDVSNEEINNVLQEAYDGSTVEEYHFWLADNDFSNAPHNEENGTPESGTEPPISEDWTSPFKDKSIEDAAAFLKTIPDELCVDWHYFAVLGEDFTKRRVVTICRIGDRDLKGDEIHTLPYTVARSTLFLSSMKPFQWEEASGNYDGENPLGRD